MISSVLKDDYLTKRIPLIFYVCHKLAKCETLLYLFLDEKQFVSVIFSHYQFKTGVFPNLGADRKDCKLSGNIFYFPTNRVILQIAFSATKQVYITNHLLTMLQTKDLVSKIIKSKTRIPDNLKVIKWAESRKVTKITRIVDYLENYQNMQISNSFYSKNISKTIFLDTTVK